MWQGGPPAHVGLCRLASRTGGINLRATVSDHYIAFWPGGMPLLVSGVSSLVGLEHYPRKLMWVSVLVWSLVLFLIYSLLRPIRHPLLALGLPLSFFVFPAACDWTLGYGTLLSESLSTACFVGGLALLWSRLHRDRHSHFVWAGLTLGLATNFRSYFLVTIRPTLLVLLLAMIVVMRRSGGTWRELCHFWWGALWHELMRHPLLFLEGAALLLCGLASWIGLGIFWWRTRGAAWGLSCLGISVFVLVNAAIFTFAHYEWRYSLPLRYGALFAAQLVFGAAPTRPA